MSEDKKEKKLQVCSPDLTSSREEKDDFCEILSKYETPES